MPMVRLSPHESSILRSHQRHQHTIHGDGNITDDVEATATDEHDCDISVSPDKKHEKSLWMKALGQGLPSGNRYRQASIPPLCGTDAPVDYTSHFSEGDLREPPFNDLVGLAGEAADGSYFGYHYNGGSAFQRGKRDNVPVTSPRGRLKMFPRLRSWRSATPCTTGETWNCASLLDLRLPSPETVTRYGPTPLINCKTTPGSPYRG